MVVITPGNNGSEILRHFGIKPERCIKADIHFRANRFVSIDVEMMAEVQDQEQLKTEIKKFKLVPIDE
jgi:hypothetical protein